MTAGLVLAQALSGGSTAAAVAAALLWALLGSVAYFIKHARERQDTTELLLASSRMHARNCRRRVRTG